MGDRSNEPIKTSDVDRLDSAVFDLKEEVFTACGDLRQPCTSVSDQSDKGLNNHQPAEIQNSLQFTVPSDHLVNHVSYENSEQGSKSKSEVDGNNDDDENVMLLTKVDMFGFMHPAGSEIVRETRLDPRKMRNREKKWLEMLSNWTYYMTEKYEKVRERCRKGIPSSLRGRAWKNLCGASFHMDFGVNKDVFEKVKAKPGDPHCLDEIRKDLNRQFPQHVMFSLDGPYGKNGMSDLYEVLKAYTVLHPEEGYCQAQAPIAAVLLMHMPLRDAFYCFVQVCHKYLPGYFSAGLETVQIDGDILFQILNKKSRNCYLHLKKYHVDPLLYMVEWFLCIYCRALPWPTVLRVWDMFFCEGVKVLFKVAVVLIHYALGSREQREEFNDFHSIVTRLKNLPEEITSEDFLIEKVINLNLDDEEMGRIHYRIMKTRQMRTNLNNN